MLYRYIGVNTLSAGISRVHGYRKIFIDQRKIIEHLRKIVTNVNHVKKIATITFWGGGGGIICPIIIHAS